VSNVNTTIIRNVYVNKTVVVNNTTTNNVSYNGGAGGLAVHPTPAQLAAANQPHLGLTRVQQQHIVQASQDRNLLASVNHGTPAVAAVAKPLSATSRAPNFAPVTAADKAAAPHPMVEPAPLGKPAPAPKAPTVAQPPSHTNVGAPVPAHKTPAMQPSSHPKQPPTHVQPAGVPPPKGKPAAPPPNGKPQAQPEPEKTHAPL
jgi:hypothetical protein